MGNRKALSEGPKRPYYAGVFSQRSKILNFCFYVEGKKLYGPRGWLSCLSPVFYNICSNEQFSDAKEGRATLKDDRYEDFLAFLEVVVPIPHIHDPNYPAKKYTEGIIGLANKYLIQQNAMKKFIAEVLEVSPLMERRVKDDALLRAFKTVFQLNNLESDELEDALSKLSPLKRTVCTLQNLSLEYQSLQGLKRTIEILEKLEMDIPRIVEAEKMRLQKNSEQIGRLPHTDHPFTISKESEFHRFHFWLKDGVVYVPGDVLALKSPEFAKKYYKHDVSYVFLQTEKKIDACRFFEKLNPAEQLNFHDFTPENLQISIRIAEKLKLQEIRGEMVEEIFRRIESLDTTSEDHGEKLVSLLKIMLIKNADSTEEVIRVPAFNMSVAAVIPLFQFLAERHNESVKRIVHKYIKRDLEFETCQGALEIIQQLSEYYNHKFLSSLVLDLIVNCGKRSFTPQNIQYIHTLPPQIISMLFHVNGTYRSAERELLYDAMK